MIPSEHNAKTTFMEKNFIDRNLIKNCTIEFNKTKNRTVISNFVTKYFYIHFFFFFFY